MYFQLLYGIHNDIQTGKHYSAGDVIQSDADLVKLFGANKFRKLTDKEVAALNNQDDTASEEQPKRIRKVKRHKKVINIAKP